MYEEDEIEMSSAFDMFDEAHGRRSDPCGELLDAVASGDLEQLRQLVTTTPGSAYVNKATQRKEWVWMDMQISPNYTMESFAGDDVRPVHLAVLAANHVGLDRSLAMLKVLHEAGADLTASDSDGFTLCAQAITHMTSTKILAWLLERGVNMNAANNKGEANPRNANTSARPSLAWLPAFLVLQHPSRCCPQSRSLHSSLFARSLFAHRLHTLLPRGSRRQRPRFSISRRKGLQHPHEVLQRLHTSFRRRAERAQRHDPPASQARP